MSQEGFRISRKLAFPTIDLLIKHYQEHSLGNHFSSIKTKLSKLPTPSKIQALLSASVSKGLVVCVYA